MEKNLFCQKQIAIDILLFLVFITFHMQKQIRSKVKNVENLLRRFVFFSRFIITHQKKNWDENKNQCVITNLIYLRFFVRIVRIVRMIYMEPSVIHWPKLSRWKATEGGIV